MRGAGFSGVLFHLSRVMNVCEVSRNTNIAWGSPASKKKQQASPSKGGGRKSPTAKQSPTASPKAKVCRGGRPCLGKKHSLFLALTATTTQSLSKGDIKAPKAKPVASPPPERPASPVVAPTTNAWIKPKDGKPVANAWESSNTVREKLIAPSSPINLETRNARSSGEAGGGGGGGASAPATPKEVFSSLEHSPAMGSPPGATRSRSLFQEDSGAVSPSTASMHNLGGSKGKRRTEICTILELADLPLTYDDVFRDYGVDSKADILALSEEDWALLEFKPFHRKKLQDFLQSAK